MRIGLIVGSLRKDSWNRKIAEVTKDLFPENVKVDFIDISKLPFYNEDLDGENIIDEYTSIRNQIKEHDAFIFFTPEYNRSYAPAVKNAIDIASKDPIMNPWRNKPAAVFSASIGGYGAMAANHALRQTFVCVDLIPMQQPEVYISRVHTLFDESGNINEDTKSFLKKAVNVFLKHVQRFEN